MTLDEFRTIILSRDLKPVPSGNGFVCRCPAHEDGNPSLSVGEGADGRILLKCHAGCATESVLASLGLAAKDLFAEESAPVSRFGVPLRIGSTKPASNPPTSSRPALRQVAVYPYHDGQGEVLFEVVRYEPKTFRQRVPDPSEPSGYRHSTKNVEKPLFHLPAVLAAREDGETVYVCEGEKDVLALESLGLCATTNPGGAGKFTVAQAETLSQTNVVVLADLDLPGVAHARDVVEKIRAAGGVIVAVFNFPDRNGLAIKDAADFVAAGGTAPELAALVANPPPMRVPAAPASQGTAANGAVRGSFGAIFLPNEAKIRGDLLAEIMGIRNDPALKDNAARRNALIAEEVIKALLRLGQFYYNLDLQIPKACLYFNRASKELLVIESGVFYGWLAKWIVVNRSEKTWEAIIKAVLDTAIEGANTSPVVPELYWARRKDPKTKAVTVYLSNGDGRVVRINAKGIRVVDNGTDGVLFAAGKTLIPWNLVPPVDPFVSCKLFSEMRTKDAHAALLAKLWVYSMPTCPTTKPPALFTGVVGAGKTRTARGIQELYGIPPKVQKVESEGEENFWTAINGGGLLILDNADTRQRWLPDSLAAAATGGSVSKRVLYTDTDEIMLKARAWVVVTSANPSFASDAGLADRLAVVRMERGEKDTEDETLTEEIIANRDAGLSHIVATIQTALADQNPVSVGLNYRFPDHGRFSLRIGRALGVESEATEALTAAEVDKSVICFENDAVLSALLEFIDSIGSFQGTAKELGDALAIFEPAISDNCTPKKLGKRIRGHWTHVRAMMTACYEENDRGSARFLLKSNKKEFVET